MTSFEDINKEANSNYKSYQTIFVEDDTKKQTVDDDPSALDTFCKNKYAIYVFVAIFSLISVTTLIIYLIINKNTL